jgi:NAD(P)H dehydrogenase (quinone)
MIVITGATGALNGATTEELLKRLPADRIGVSVRDVEKARHFADRGVRVRRGSYDDPAALREAFAGADEVLLVSSNDRQADTVSLHRTAIEAAVAAGARRIYYTSHQGAHPDGPFAPGRVHAATEAILADSGVAWTSFRNGFYAHSLDWMLGPWQQTGVMSAAADGPVSWTERADAAEAAAIIIAGERSYDGPVTLTAREAVTVADIARTASGLTGRTIEAVELSDEDWVADRVAQGGSEPMVRLLLTCFQAAREGRFAGVDPLLATLLGREPRTVADLLSDRITV